MKTVYLTWESPAWLFKERNKEFFQNIVAIVFFLLVILFFAREIPLIFAVVSVSFLLYVFSTVRPGNVVHAITNLGIETAGKMYQWNELKEFWFEQQWGKEVVIVTTEQNHRVMMIVEGLSKDDIKEVMMRFLSMREVPERTFSDKAASWISRKIPLETTKNQ